MNKYFLIPVVIVIAGCTSQPPSPTSVSPPTSPAPPVGPLAVNKEYANWSRFPVGTTVVRQSVTERGDSKVTSVETFVLKRVTESEVEVERQNTTERNDGTYKAENPPEIRTFTKSFALPPGMSEADFVKPSLKAERVKAETVEVLGTKYETVVFRWTDGTEAGPMKITLWESDAVPGRMVKQTMVVEKKNQTMTETIVRLTIPKS